jgi:hypothetical protein
VTSKVAERDDRKMGEIFSEVEPEDLRKYLSALIEIVRSPNQKVLMFPIEATSVLGTLVGIAEIVNATFSGTPSSTTGSAPP